MNAKKTLLLFLSNFIIICFPIFILFVMGPSEIFLAIIRNLDLSIRNLGGNS